MILVRKVYYLGITCEVATKQSTLELWQEG